MRLSVIVYEDEPLLRNQLEKVFHTLREEFHLLDSFPHPRNVSLHLDTYKPDIIIMDIQMESDDDGLYALYKIKKSYPHTKVMMLTTFDQDDKVFNAISLGADGYMLKSDFSSYQFPQEAIRKSLRVIMDDGAYLTPSVAKQILNLFSNQTIVELIKNVKERFNAVFKNEIGENKSNRFTRMQLIVLREISEGKSTAEIAKELQLSQNTINTHIKAIYNTLQVNSRAMAIKKALEDRLVRTGS